MSIDIAELRKLSNEEKLKIVELLWDDIGASCEPITLPTWQVEESMRSDKELNDDPSIAIDRDQLWSRVDG